MLQKTRLQELGPRFTLKLKWMQVIYARASPHVLTATLNGFKTCAYNIQLFGGVAFRICGDNNHPMAHPGIHTHIHSTSFADTCILRHHKRIHVPMPMQALSLTPQAYMPRCINTVTLWSSVRYIQNASIRAYISQPHQAGTFDTETGEYEWVRRRNKIRTKFAL